MSRTLIPAAPARAAHPHRGVAWLRSGVTATAGGLAFCALAVADALAVTGLILAADLLLRDGDVVGRPGASVRLIAVLALIPVVMLVIRWLATLTRTLAAQWCGVPIAVPYRVLSGGQDAVSARTAQRLRLALTDPATWRDVLWAVVNPVGAFLLAAIPVALAAAGLFGLVLPAVRLPLPLHQTGVSQAWQPILLGLIITVLGLWVAPSLLTEPPRSFRRLHLVRGRWSRGTWNELSAGVAGAGGPDGRRGAAGLPVGLAGDRGGR